MSRHDALQSPGVLVDLFELSEQVPVEEDGVARAPVEPCRHYWRIASRVLVDHRIDHPAIHQRDIAWEHHDRIGPALDLRKALPEGEALALLKLLIVDNVAAVVT